MRIIISAIALVLAIGVALPGPAEARAPRKVQRWGCTFKAWGIASEGLNTPAVWFGGGDIYRCDRQHRFVIRVSIVEDVPGGPDRVYSLQKYVKRHPRDIGGIRYTVRGGECAVDGTPPTANPVYLRMKVKRAGRPGVVKVASRNVANPCPVISP